jgi:FixJ family two-component response regulator
MPDTEPLIAIVEDDPSIRRAFDRLLRATGFAVRAFGSAEQFLEDPAPESYACLLLDIRLPGMSGLELHRALGPAAEGVPVIFMTAHDDEAIREEVSWIADSTYLAKPFPGSALIAAINASLAGRGNVRRNDPPADKK